MAEEAVVAGRLEIPVESDTGGFRKKLEKKINELSEGIVASIGVDVDADGLKERLEAVVGKAARGVNATIGVELDSKGLRAKLKAAAGAVTAELDVDGNLTEKVKKATAKAQAEAKKSPIGVVVDATDRLRARTVAWIKEMRAYARKNPVEVDVKTKGRGGGGGPGSAMMAFKPLLVLSVLSLIQPAIAAIVGSLGGLVAMVGNLGSAIGVLGAAPGVLGGLVGIFAALKIAFSGMTGDIEKLPKPMAAVRKEVESFKGAWDDVKKSVQEEFWGPLVGRVKPVIKKLLPDLNSGLSMLAKTTGGVAKNFLDWLGSDEFSHQMPSLFRNGNVLAKSLGGALLGMAKGAMNMSEAAEPLIERMGGVIDKFGKWAAAIAKPGKKQEEFTEFLDYAADKAGQLWDMIMDLGGAFKGIFSAGRESGDRLLDTLVGVLDKWNKWVNDPAGQKRIKEWFDNVEPITRAAGNLIVGIGAAIARLAEDPNTAKLLNKITNELLPSLENFLNDLGKDLGPKIVDFVTEVLDILSQMSDAGGPLATGLGIVNDGLQKLGDFLEEHPDAAKALGTILGGLLAFKALKFLGGKSGINSLLGGLATGIGKVINFKPSDLFGGKGGKAGGGKGGIFGGLKDLFSNTMNVKWSTPMPVYVTNPGAGAGGDGDIYGGDGKDGKKKPKGGKPKGGKLGKLGRGLKGLGGKFGRLGKGLGGLLGAAGGGKALSMIRGRMVGGGERGSIALGGKAAGKLGKAGGFLGGLFKGGAKKGGLIGGLFGKATLGKVGGGLLKAVKGGGVAGIVASVAGGFALDKVSEKWGGGKVGAGKGGLVDTAVGAGKGALTGGAIGATIGSIVPVIGTAIGGAVGAGIGGVIGGVKAANWDNLKTDTVNTWNSITATVTSKSAEIGTAISTKWGEITSWTSTKWGEVTGAVSGAWTSIKNGTVTKAAELGTAVATKWGEVKDWTSTKWGEIKGAVVTKATELKDAAVTKASEVKTAVSTRWDTLKTNTSGAWESIRSSVTSKFSSAKASVATYAENMRSTASSKFSQIKSSAAAGFESVRSTVSQKFSSAASTVRTKIGDALGQMRRIRSEGPGAVAVDLSYSGSKIIGSLISGIRSRIGDLRSIVSLAAQTVRDHWPFSPAKTGPLRTHPMDVAGSNLVKMLRDGINSERGGLASTMAAIAGDVAGQDYQLGALRNAGAAARKGLYGAGVGAGVVFEEGSVQIQNPVPEKASDSIADGARKVGALGLFG